MAYTEWYVDNVLGDDLYSGSTDATPVSSTDCDLTNISSYDYQLHDTLEGGWSGVQVGDVGVWDATGAKETFVVVETNYDSSAHKLKVNTIGAPGAMTTAEEKTVHIGGPWESIGHGLGKTGTPGMLTTDWVNSDGDPPRLNIKYNGGAAYDEEGLGNNAFTVTTTLTVEAYATTPGDIDWTTSTNRVLIEPSSPSEAQILYSTGPYVIWKNLYFRMTGNGDYGVRTGTSSDNQSWLNCKFYCEDLHGFYPHYAADYVNWIRCDFSDCGGDGMTNRLGVGCVVAGCRFANNAGNGMIGSNRILIINSLIYGNTSYGVGTGGNWMPILVAGNIIADNGSGGVNIGSPSVSSPPSAWINNIIADNGGPGIDESWSAGKNIFGMFDHNCFHGNTTPIDDTYFIDTSEHNITDEPWVETTQATRKTNGDYRITAAMKAAGFPGLMPDTTITSDEGFVDLGPLQHEDAGGGGGAGGTRVIGPGTVVG